MATKGALPVDDEPGKRDDRAEPAARNDRPVDESDDYGRSILLGTAAGWRRGRRVFRRIPSSPRCKLCASPFGGPAGRVMRAFGKAPWPKNPQYCAACFRFLSDHRAGAEIECSLLFADVRGSTSMAEGMRPAAFRQLMDGFFEIAADVLVDHDGVVDKFVGDEVVGLFIPALAGSGHARRAITAALALMEKIGERSAERRLPIGAGVHTGIAFVGTVGDGDHVDFTAMGDAVNVAARLASAAGAGETLVTLAAVHAANWSDAGLEHRSLALKGKSQATDVLVLVSTA